MLFVLIKLRFISTHLHIMIYIKYRFAQKVNLKKHMLCHTAGNGHPCPHCSMNFRTREDVAHHVLKQHPGLAISTASSRSPAPKSIANRQQNQGQHQQNDVDEGHRSQTGMQKMFIDAL